MRETLTAQKAEHRVQTVLVWLILSLGMLVSCNGTEPPKQKSGDKPAVPVAVAPVVLDDVPLELNAFGRAQSKASVTIKAQVAQVIETVHFQEGQELAVGDLLFTLNSRPYEVALSQAQAVLARDKVSSERAQAEVERNAGLLKQGLLAQSEFDRVKTAADVLIKTLKSDQTAIDAARIDLDNCTIASPISGRAGKVLVHAGNLVSANVPLVIINQIKPIDVYFSLPQFELDRVRKYADLAPLEVEVTLPDEPNRPEKGVLTFIDNQVDTTNGTVEFGVTLPNPEERLWPGRYVLIRLVLAIERDLVVIPRTAIETSSQGQHVFVVKGEQTVEQRSIQVARTRGDYAVVGAGLSAGESVVTDGQLQLVDGTKVEVITKDPRAAQPKEVKPPEAGSQAPAPGPEAVERPNEATTGAAPALGTASEPKVRTPQPTTPSSEGVPETPGTQAPETEAAKEAEPNATASTGVPSSLGAAP